MLGPFLESGELSQKPEWNIETPVADEARQSENCVHLGRGAEGALRGGERGEGGEAPPFFFFFFFLFVFLGPQLQHMEVPRAGVG